MDTHGRMQRETIGLRTAFPGKRDEPGAPQKEVEVEAPLPHDLEVVAKKMDRYAQPSR